jgi:pyruvate dehydrogenase E2 component (dihydrolipoamide acetyltransferase)
MDTLVEVKVPDIGDFDAVEVIEILVAEGDMINVDDSLITVESDKASMEIPSSHSGVVKEIVVAIDDKVNEGSIVLMIEAVKDSASDQAKAKAEAEKAVDTVVKPLSKESTETAIKERAEPVTKTVAEKPVAKAPIVKQQAIQQPAKSSHQDFVNAHASPSIRKFARELGVDLGKVKGSGRNTRIIKQDIQNFIKESLARPSSAVTGGTSTLGVEPMPEVDFSQWGDIETVKLSKINQLTGKFLHRNWVNIPHVTQFDEADISELEDFRKQSNANFAKTKSDIKLTLLSFLMKAIVASLKKFPRFNSSLSNDGTALIQKNYFHIGVAVATVDGLVVPVIRDVDQKSLGDLALDLKQASQKARDKKLKPADMQGGCFTISSLGGIGGTKFTPIVNAPEVAILGVSKASMQPVWDGSEFKPRLICPLSLSYDHRVIDGAEGAAFTNYLSSLLSDIRTLLI